MDEEILNDNFFSYKLAFSVLTKKPVKIKLEGDYKKKKSIIKMISSLTINTIYKMEGETVLFQPGSLTDKKQVIICPTGDIFDYILPILLFTPFIRLDLKFKGITDGDHCIDTIRIVHFTLMKKFHVEGVELDIKKRGFSPEGGGEVTLKSKGGLISLPPVDMVEEARLIKMRGLVVTSRLSHQVATVISEYIKDFLKDFSNTKIFNNVVGRDSGISPGYFITLFSESEEGIFYSETNGKDMNYEDAAEKACKTLMKAVIKGGVFDYKLTPLLLSFMALTSDTSRARIYKVEEEFMGILRKFFGYEYTIKEGILSSVGCGYKHHQ